MDAITTQLKQYGHVKSGAVMSKYTTFHVGGAVRWLVEVDHADQLVRLLNFLTGEGIEYFILGGGSNLLWRDEAYEGVVVKIAAKSVRAEGADLVAEAGAPLAGVVMNAMQAGLAGLEWAAGVPGTVGGAVRGNVGAMDSNTSRSVSEITVWRDGEVLALAPSDCAFSYRDSIFKHNSDVVLSARYGLAPGDKKAMMLTIQGHIKKRNGRYPSLPSAGSFFKNVDFADWPGDTAALPPEFQAQRQVPAGWINEQNGLKGFVVGGAMVSLEHGNFLINAKNATQADVKAVVEEVQARAYTTFGVQLEPEVHIH